jgi:hypothetical protein
MEFDDANDDDFFHLREDLENGSWDESSIRTN